VSTALQSDEPEIPRLVLDTNVVLDCLHFRDAAALPLWQALTSGRCHCFADEYALAELRRVLAYPEFKLDAAVRDATWEQYRDVAQGFDVRGFFRTLPRCRDPDDQPFVILAAATGAGLLVSKDRALLEMNRRGGLGFAIVTPAEACRRLGLDAAAA
jgi:putative PIN family toxin of toxin-antitoxin system